MSIAADFANRALEGEGWARERLAAHAGKTMRVDVGPLRVGLAIDTGGQVAASDAPPALTITIDPLRVPSLLAQPSRWSELTSAEGDETLAATIAELAPTLPWFVERLLSRALGPIAGQQVADAGRRLLAFPEYAGERFADSFARYIGGEAQLATRTADVRRFAADVAEISKRVDLLAVRVDALKAQGR